MRLHPVTLPDDSVSDIRLFDEHNPDIAAPNPSQSGKPLIAVWPGWGMGARYYDPLCAELAWRGYPVMSGELRGQGSNTARATRSHQWGYHHMASQDFPLSIQAAKRELGLAPEHPVVLVCHSMSGQIATLLLAREASAEHTQNLNIVTVLGVGAGAPYFPAFPGKAGSRLRWGSLVMAKVAGVLGFWPDGKWDIAGYGRQSGTHVQEWAHFAQTAQLENLLDEDIDYRQAKKRVRTPIVLTRCVDDEDCPLDSARYLADTVPQAKVSIEQLNVHLGHNRWARVPEAVANRVEELCAEHVADDGGNHEV